MHVYDLILLSIEFVVGADRLGKYLGGGEIPASSGKLEDLLSDAPRLIQDHCKLVATGTHVAAMIQS